MIRFNDRFEAERDKYQWVLYEWRDGIPTAKHPNPKRQKDETYHATLKQVCSAIIDRSAGDCTDIKELRALLTYADQALLDMTEAVHGLTKGED